MKHMRYSRCLLLAVGIVLLCCGAARAQEALGRWRDCPDMTQIYSVEAADGVVYGAGKAGLLRFGVADRSLDIISRAKGLSDVGIAVMAYDTASQCLVVAYDNANVDILHGGRVYNLPDIKRSEFSANKEIHAIAFSDSTAYLATGFGVVVVDLWRYEIDETWLLGDGGGQLAVNAIAFTTDSIYAATADGLKRLPRDEAHPGIADRWQACTSPIGSVVDHLAYDGRRLWLAASISGTDTHSVYTLDDNGLVLRHIGLLASLHTAQGLTLVSLNDTVFVHDSTAAAVDTLVDYTWGPLKPHDATVADDGTVWVANPWDGIIAIMPDGSDDVVRPDSPMSGDNVYRLVPFAGHMYLCPGGHTSTYQNTFIAANLCTATGSHWQSIDASNGMLVDVYDLVDIAVNPRDTAETVLALWGTGLATVRDNSVQAIYDDVTTGGALQRYIDGTVRAGAVAFDRRGNLWATVSHTTHALVERTADGQWRSFATTALAPLLQVDKILCDSVRGYIWMAGSDNAIYVHDGESRLARVNPNQGSKLQTETVNALAQDQNGSIWIGTNKGIKVIYDSYNAFKNGGTGETAPVNCSNITMSNGLFAEYLMAYENITAIAVDGAGRKWVGTATGGLYLISANGLEQLEHFTVTNSPLFSDKVVALGIQPRSGEVYVGTDRGLQVYRSTATYAEAAPRDDIHAFPNPVRPGYDGPIAIKGFTRNALVHITDAAGHTVFSTQAYGGQAIWDGRTASGEPVASGVYYVFASDSDGGNRSVTKVLIVR